MRDNRYALHIHDKEKMLMGSILNTAYGLIIQKKTTFYRYCSVRVVFLLIFAENKLHLSITTKQACCSAFDLHYFCKKEYYYIIGKTSYEKILHTYRHDVRHGCRHGNNACCHNA